MSATIPAPPNLLDPAHVEDPLPGLGILLDHYPVHWDESLGSWLISRYADIRPLNRASGAGPAIQELLGQHFADATLFLAMDGIDHRRRRAILAPFFARGGVEGHRDIIEREARALLEPIFQRERAAVAAGERERGEMNFVTEFSAPFPVNVVGAMLALPPSDHDRIRSWFEAWIGAEGNISGDPALVERARWARGDYEEYIAPIIAERRTGDGDDLISRMCRAERDGFTLSDDEIQSIAGVTILGGGETTDHQLGWLMEALIRYPDQQRELADDRSLMDNALAEGMRYCSIVQYIPRTLVADQEVGGVTIRSDDPVALVIAAGNHDPRRWDEPNEFNLHRADHDAAKAFTGSAEHLGFGGGPHFCIGSHLSKAEMEIGLGVFFDHVRDVRLADGFEPHARPESFFVRALPSLQISFDLA